MRFFQREIKEDGKGLYVHYGPCRLRPTTKKTRFSRGETVSLTPESRCYDIGEGARVFGDIEEYEIWKRSQP